MEITTTPNDIADLTAAMATCDRTAEDNGWQAEDTIDIAGRTWAVTADAAWTMLGDDADTMAQVFADGTTENVEVAR